jgi:hypothetical protein
MLDGPEEYEDFTNGGVLVEWVTDALSWVSRTAWIIAGPESRPIWYSRVYLVPSVGAAPAPE